MTLRSRINGLVFTAAILVAASGAMGQTGRYEMLWGAFGPNEPQVQTSLVAPMKRDGTIVLYTGQAGLYPKVWQGQNVNGGVPVACDMNAHLTRLRDCLDWYVPQNFSGYAVIDYEDWDALWVHTPEQYRELTRNVVRAQYANLTPAQVEEYSIRDHEAAAKDFMLRTINECKRLRPNAKWGYYGYPRDYHIGANETTMQWLWDAQTAFYPVAYTVYPVSSTSPAPWAWAPPEYYPELMTELVGTSRRLAGSRPVAAFAWCRYHEMNPTFGNQMLREADLRQMLREPRLKGANALIFWEYVDGQAEVQEYNNYFSTMLASMARDVDLEFNPPSNGQNGSNNNGNVPPPAPPVVNIPTPPPAPPVANNTNTGGNAAPPSNGGTGTYTNTSIPGSPWTNTNTNTTASNGGNGEPAPTGDPNQPTTQPADPNAPAAGEDATPAPAPVKVDPKKVKTKVNSKLAAKTSKRTLQRDLDRAAALIKAQERQRLALAAKAAKAAKKTALADAPTGD